MITKSDRPPELIDAQTEPDILAALAARTWARWHDSGDGAPVPTVADLVAFRPDAPAAATDESNARLTALFGGEPSIWATIRHGDDAAVIEAVTPAGDAPVLRTLALVHAEWVRRGGSHSFAPLVDAWQRRPVPVQLETRVDRRILPRVSVSISEHPAREIGQLFGAALGRYEPHAPTLPLFPERPAPKAVPLLDLVDAAGVRIALTLRQLRDGLFPNGWEKRRDWPRLRDALLSAHTYGTSDGRGACRRRSGSAAAQGCSQPPG